MPGSLPRHWCRCLNLGNRGLLSGLREDSSWAICLQTVCGRRRSMLRPGDGFLFGNFLPEDGISQARWSLHLSGRSGRRFRRSDLVWVSTGPFGSAKCPADTFVCFYSVTHINNPAIAHWRILFLIEGLPSLLLAIVVLLFLPSRPETTRYLSTDERTLACTRLNAEALGSHNSGLEWSAVRRAFLSKRTWIAAAMYSAMNLGLSSVSRYGENSRSE